MLPMPKKFPTPMFSTPRAGIASAAGTPTAPAGAAVTTGGKTLSSCCHGVNCEATVEAPP
ncbi:Uncharacterised protein [Mycobacterium tuberculosis]|nr:Uncharacterised protein [Mycobacterium tuberculosis]